MTDVEVAFVLGALFLMTMFHLFAWTSRDALYEETKFLQKQINHLDNQVEGLIKELKRLRPKPKRNPKKGKVKANGKKQKSH